MGESRPSKVTQPTQAVGQESQPGGGDTDRLRMYAETWGKWGVLGGVRADYRLVLPGLPFCSAQALTSWVWQFGLQNCRLRERRRTGSRPGEPLEGGAG